MKTKNSLRFMAVNLVIICIYLLPNNLMAKSDKSNSKEVNYPNDHVKQSDSYYSQFQIGQTYYLLADGVNIRSSASLSSDVIANLPIGKKVTISKIDPSTLTRNGYTTNWYQVSFDFKNKNLTGYVWGALISTKTVADQQDKTLLFHYGIESVEKFKEQNYEYEKIKIQVRVSQHNKQLSKLVFDGIGSIKTTNSIKVLDNKGLKNVQSIVYLNFSDEYCGGAFGDVVLFWTGKKLMYAKTLKHGFDAPMFYEENLIFPKDKGGQPNRIIWTARGGEHGDDGKDKIETNKRMIYRWNGNRLVKS